MLLLSDKLYARKGTSAPRSGTQTHLATLATITKYFADSKPLTTCRGGDYAATQSPAVSRRAGSLKTVYIGKR